jgi:hypothetical protein
LKGTSTLAYFVAATKTKKQFIVWLKVLEMDKHSSLFFVASKKEKNVLI